MVGHPGPVIERVLGVYDADGTLRGELAYVVGKVRGTAHCALCDLTHGRLRRRKDFAAACAALPVELDLRHRDELEPPVAAALAGRFPCVAAVHDDGRVEVLLDAAALEACAADPDRFVARLQAVLAQG